MSAGQDSNNIRWHLPASARQYFITHHKETALWLSTAAQIVAKKAELSLLVTFTSAGIVKNCSVMTVTEDVARTAARQKNARSVLPSSGVDSVAAEVDAATGSIQKELASQYSQ